MHDAKYRTLNHSNYMQYTTRTKGFWQTRATPRERDTHTHTHVQDVPKEYLCRAQR